MSTEERALTVSVEVMGSQSGVWDAWTTPAGIRSFFAPACNVDIRPLGAYEIYFDPDAESGQRGAEDNLVLAVQPEQLLSFTWNFPKKFAQLRDQRTVIIIRLESTEPDRTTVHLTQLGWGSGDLWDAAYEYFERAWGNVVLARLKRRFEDGAIDWQEES